MTSPADKPRLRPVARRELLRGGERLLVLHDPSGLSDPVALPHEAEPLLEVLDGQRTLSQIRQSLVMRGVLDVSLDDLRELLEELSAAGFLDDEAFRARAERTRSDYLGSPARPPRLAGVFYPEAPDALTEALHALFPGPAARLRPGSPAVGVLLPHQPLPTRADPEGGAPRRAAALADQVLRELPPAHELDLIVVLAADRRLTATPHVISDKRLATPGAELPGAPDLVRALERRLPWIRREELRHRGALGIEVAALHLRHLYDRACPPVLPILCGPGASAETPEVEAFLAAAEHVLGDRRILWWIAAELSHAGPAHGGPPLDAAGRALLAARDAACLDAFLAARPAALARACGELTELGAPSGAAALMSALSLLPVGYQAAWSAYAAAPPIGDEDGAVGLAAARLVLSDEPGE